MATVIKMCLFPKTVLGYLNNLILQNCCVYFQKPYTTYESMCICSMYIYGSSVLDYFLISVWSVREVAQMACCANMPTCVLLPHLIEIGSNGSMLCCILHILISCQVILLCL